MCSMSLPASAWIVACRTSEAEGGDDAAVQWLTARLAGRQGDRRRTIVRAPSAPARALADDLGRAWDAEVRVGGGRLELGVISRRPGAGGTRPAPVEHDLVVVVPPPSAQRLLGSLLERDPSAGRGLRLAPFGLAEVEPTGDGAAVLKALESPHQLRAIAPIPIAPSRCRVALIADRQSGASPPAREPAAGRTDAGEPTADALAHLAASLDFEAVYAGEPTTYRRTAMSVAPGAELVVEPGFSEDVSPGIGKGMRTTIHIGHVRDALARLARSRLGRTVGVVAHPWVIGSLICQSAGLHPRTIRRLDMRPGSVSLVEVDGEGQGEVLALNQTSGVKLPQTAAGDRGVHASKRTNDRAAFDSAVTTV